METVVEAKEVVALREGSRVAGGIVAMERAGWQEAWAARVEMGRLQLVAPHASPIDRAQSNWQPLTLRGCINSHLGGHCREWDK